MQEVRNKTYRLGTARRATRKRFGRDGIFIAPNTPMMAWIFVERPPRLMPMACFCFPFCAAGRTVGFHDHAVDQIQPVARLQCQLWKIRFQMPRRDQWLKRL